MVTSSKLPNKQTEGEVRLSGRSAVLQVQKRGEWKTVCSEEWNNQLGISACKQLGYSRYVESFFISLTSIEQDLQTNLISINYSQAEAIKLQNAFRYATFRHSKAGLCSITLTFFVTYRIKEFV
ncbi:hypothetical protein AMECASPLE_018227 [Ameca splendens]|uniref:SRCR domain-containing protein n=1 Tax=Ameca splendens TaxID=208324 RepID=A0ABV0Y344_9TELE